MTATKTLVNVLGVVYVHTKADDGGDMYFTRFAESRKEFFRLHNWYDPEWFNAHKVRLKGTGSVYRVPTRKVAGESLTLVVKTCRVGEDVPDNTHTLKEFCDAEFNSPWEEFFLVSEMREGLYGPRDKKIVTQRPLLIYVPPEPMQLWQSGRNKSRMNRIRARHPGVDLDILKQYILVYEWIEGLNLPETFEHVRMGIEDRIRHLKALNSIATADMLDKGYLVADMKPEHVIIAPEDVRAIIAMGAPGTPAARDAQIEAMYGLMKECSYSVVDYELLQRTPVHEEEVKLSRRHHYLDDQRDRFIPTDLPDHLSGGEIMGVPYIYGRAESTGGRLWVVGNNARLFDYFLPERWRKTPSNKLSDTKEIFHTLTKDNIHLVWCTSRVGEMPDEADDQRIAGRGFNSPFEEFAIAHDLARRGVPSVYIRAIYMTGVPKVEPSQDLRKYDSHGHLLDPEGNPILQETHNYITIRGYYNGPDEWVARQKGPLYTPMDVANAVDKRLITQDEADQIVERVKQSLDNAGYDGSLLVASDVLLSLDESFESVQDTSGNPLAIICNFELIYKKP